MRIIKIRFGRSGLAPLLAVHHISIMTATVTLFVSMFVLQNQ